MTIGQCPDQSYEMQITTDSNLTITQVGPVALLTLNRPSVRNALSSSLVDEIDTAMRLLDADGSTNAIVLTGTAPGFCAGSDLKELSGMSVTGMATHEARTGQVVRSFQLLRKPIVAAVEGFAVGGGFLLATGCDVVISADNAIWDLPEVRLGWVPPWGLQTLVARTGPANARRLAWGYQQATAADLLRLKVIDELVQPGLALQRAMEVAGQLAALPPEACASVKQVFSDAVAGPAEWLDAQANKLFGRDCESDAGLTTLASFARKMSKEKTR